MQSAATPRGAPDRHTTPIDASTTTRPNPMNHAADPNGLQTAKLLGVAALTVDHVTKLAFGAEAEFLLPVINHVGFSVLAALMALRLAEDPDRDLRYLRRMILPALCAIPAYGLFFAAYTDTPPSPRLIMVAGTTNIIATYALGVATFAVVRRIRHADPHPIALTAAAPLALLPAAASAHVQYGIPGTALVPLLALVHIRLGARAHAAAAGAAVVLAEIQFGLTRGLFALPAAVAVWLVFNHRSVLPAPRLPKSFFYAYYPGRLRVLATLGA